MDSYSVEAILKVSGASKFSNDFKNATNGVEGLGSSSEKAGLTIGKLLGAVGITAAVAKGFQLMKDSISSSMKRIDTMEQFSRVMGVMTGDVDSVNNSLSRMEDITEGTSMRMDVMADGIQNFVTRGMDIGDATNTVEAWGNAVAFYGDGSNEQFQSVTDALQNMVAKGKVGQDQLNRLFHAGIPATEIYADAVGESTADVEQALSNGEISAEEFVSTVTDAMMEGTSKFPEISTAMKDMGMSWGAVMSNIGAYVDIGISDIMIAIDDMLSDNGLPEMRDMIDKFAQGFGSALSWIAGQIPVAVQAIKNVYSVLEPWMPLIKSIAAGIGAFIATFATIGTIVTVVGLVKAAVVGLWAVIAANPVGLIISLLAGLVTAGMMVYKNWEKIKSKALEVFPGLSGPIKKVEEFFSQMGEKVSSVVSKITAIWQNFPQIFSSASGVIGGIISNFTPLFERMKSSIASSLEYIGPIVENFKSIWQAVVPVIKVLAQVVGVVLVAAYGIVLSSINAVLGALGPFIAMITSVISVIMNMVNVVVSLVTGDFTGAFDSMINIVTGIFDTFKYLLDTVMIFIAGFVTGIIDFFYGLYMSLVGNSIIPDMVNAIVEWFNNMLDWVLEIVKSIVDWVVDLISGLVSAVTTYFTTMRTVITSIFNAVKAIIIAVWNYIKDTFKNALDFVLALVKGDFQGMKDAIQNQMNNAKNLLQNVWNAIKSNISGRLKSILSDVVAKFNSIKINIQSKIESARSILSSKFSQMVTTVSTKASEIIRTAKDKFESVKAGIRDKLTEAVTVVGQKIGEMPGKVMEYFDNMVSVGKSLVAGLINGIKQMGSEAIESVAGVVGGVVEKAKSLLKTKSPSRVFMGLGSNTIEGFNIGVEDQESGAIKTMSNVASSVMGAFDSRLDVPDISGQIDRVNKMGKSQMGYSLDQEMSVNTQPINVYVEGDSEWIRAYVNNENAVDDLGRVFG